MTEPGVSHDVSRWSNAGRWGTDDELGTLNFITGQVRIAAAALVRSGHTVSLAKPLQTQTSAVNLRPAWHVMHLETERPYATADSIHLQIHGLASTHLDALGHMFLEGFGYNGFAMSDVVDMAGLRKLDIAAMRDGIVTRGVLLDLTSDEPDGWLAPGTRIGAAQLEQAEERAALEVGTGDAVVVHTGLEAREAASGPEDPSIRPGLDITAIDWLHRRQVAVYTGDCIERLPLEPYGAAEMPLHQIAIARMGLVLLDCPSLSRLVEVSRKLERYEFLFTAAPLVIPGGTGSPVNPIAVF